MTVLGPACAGAWVGGGDTIGGGGVGEPRTGIIYICMYVCLYVCSLYIDRMCVCVCASVCMGQY